MTNFTLTEGQADSLSEYLDTAIPSTFLYAVTTAALLNAAKYYTDMEYSPVLSVRYTGLVNSMKEQSEAHSRGERQLNWSPEEIGFYSEWGMNYWRNDNPLGAGPVFLGVKIPVEDVETDLFSGDLEFSMFHRIAGKCRKRPHLGMDLCMVCLDAANYCVIQTYRRLQKCGNPVQESGNPDTGVSQYPVAFGYPVGVGEASYPAGHELQGLWATKTWVTSESAYMGTYASVVADQIALAQRVLVDTEGVQSQCDYLWEAICSPEKN
jgi:hypothetical protein